jgi:amidohydrolase
VNVKDAAREAAYTAREKCIALSHEIHDHPELAWEEHRACGWVGDALADAGYEVEAGAAGLDTALVATRGGGDLVVGICAEYDALPEIGHACGHNVISGAAVAAAYALAPVADELGITVKVFGTPAEESGGGKVYLLERGAFAGTHAAMMVHPSPYEQVAHKALAIADMDFTFTGRTAHAAMAPELGVNAGDAVTVAQVAIGLLRQHIKPGERVHGIVTRGGEAPNIVPGEAALSYYVRSPTLEDLLVLRERVGRCADGAATATGCELEVSSPSRSYSHFRNDADLVALYRRNAEAAGRVFPELTAEQREKAGSTDMANVSLELPAIHPMLGIECGGSVNHTPEFAAWCARPDADRAVVEGGVAMAWTIADMAADAALRARLVAA